MPFCSACIPLCRHKLNIELNTVKWLKCLSSTFGDKCLVLEIEEYKSSCQATCLTCAESRSPSFMCEASWMFGCGWQVCLSSQKSRFKKCSWLRRRWKWPLNSGGSERTNFPSCFVKIHWRELLLEGNAVRLGINERMDRNHSSLSVSVLFVPPEFSLLLTWRCSSFETLKHQMTVHFSLTWIDWQGGVTDCKKRPPVVGFGLMSYQPVWRPTSQCWHVLQFSIISVMDDDAAWGFLF